MIAISDDPLSFLSCFLPKIAFKAVERPRGGVFMQGAYSCFHAVAIRPLATMLYPRQK